MNTKKDFFSAMNIIVNNYIALACRRNFKYDPMKAKTDPSYKVKEFVAGDFGGVAYADPSKNGEDELRYNHESSDSVKSVIKYLMKKSIPNNNLVPSFLEFSDAIAETISKNIAGAERINAVKETFEEGGLIVLNVDENFEHKQSNSYGEQSFFNSKNKRVMRFNGDTGEFELITNLLTQLPREGIDYTCLDTDIDHVRAVHIDDVFSIPDVEIIYSHRAPIIGGIAEYLSNKQYA